MCLHTSFEFFLDNIVLMFMKNAQNSVLAEKKNCYRRPRIIQCYFHLINGTENVVRQVLTRLEV